MSSAAEEELLCRGILERIVQGENMLLNSQKYFQETLDSERKRHTPQGQTFVPTSGLQITRLLQECGISHVHRSSEFSYESMLEAVDLPRPPAAKETKEASCQTYSLPEPKIHTPAPYDGNDSAVKLAPGGFQAASDMIYPDKRKNLQPAGQPAKKARFMSPMV